MLELEGEMKIDPKTAMIYFKQAWTEITAITITNCFKRAAVIVPQTENTLENGDDIIEDPNLELENLGQLITRLPFHSGMLSANEYVGINDQEQVHSKFDENEIIAEIQRTYGIGVEEKNEKFNEEEVIELDSDDTPPRTVTINRAIAGLKDAENFLECSELTRIEELESVRSLIQVLNERRLVSIKQSTLDSFFSPSSNWSFPTKSSQIPH